MGFIKKEAEGMAATVKVLAALLYFPHTWLIWGGLAGWLMGWLWGVLMFVATPFMGWAAVQFFEKLDQFFGTCRAIVYFITRRWYFVRLLAERDAIRTEILDLAAEVKSEPGAVATG